MRRLSLLFLFLLFSVGCGESSPIAGKTDTAEAAVRSMQEGLTKGQPVVLWEALPESYQNDLNTLARTFASNMDADTWKQITAMLNGVHQVLSEKQEFILNYPAVASGKDPERTKKSITAGTQLLKTILDGVSDLEEMKNFDGKQFLSSTGTGIITHVNTLSEFAPPVPGQTVGMAALAELKIETVTSTDSTATLRFTGPDGKVETQEWVKSQGKWLPKEMVDEWDQKMKEARESLAKLPEQVMQMKLQMAMVSGMVNGALTPLQNAEDQDQFNAAVNGSLGMFGGFAGGFGMPGPSEPPSFDFPEPPGPPSLGDDPGSSLGDDPGSSLGDDPGKVSENPLDAPEDDK